MKSIKNEMMNSDEIDLRKIFPKGMEATQNLVSEKILVCA